MVPGLPSTHISISGVFFQFCYMASQSCLLWSVSITAVLCLALSLLFQHIFFVSQLQHGLSVSVDFSRDTFSNDLMRLHSSIPVIRLYNLSHFLKWCLQCLLDYCFILMSSKYPSKGTDHGHHVCQVLPPT